MNDTALRTHSAPSDRDLQRWRGLLDDIESGKLTEAPAIEACTELLGSVPLLLDEVRRLRAKGRELLARYEQSELDGIANYPLAPDESELLATEVSRYRALFEGTA